MVTLYNDWYVGSQAVCTSKRFPRIVRQTLVSDRKFVTQSQKNAFSELSHVDVKLVLETFLQARGTYQHHNTMYEQEIIGDWDSPRRSARRTPAGTWCPAALS